jgi:hypothetical protein
MEGPKPESQIALATECCGCSGPAVFSTDFQWMQKKGQTDISALPKPDIDFSALQQIENRPLKGCQTRRIPLAPSLNSYSPEVPRPSSILKTRECSGGTELRVSFVPDSTSGPTREESPLSLKWQDEVQTDLGANCACMANLRKELENATRQIRKQDSEIVTLRSKLRECLNEKELLQNLLQSQGYGKEMITEILSDFRKSRLGKQDQRNEEIFIRDQRIAAQNTQIDQLQSELAELRETKRARVMSAVKKDFSSCGVRRDQRVRSSGDCFVRK